jgi:transposase
LVVRSLQYMQSTQKLPHRRLDRAEKALTALTPSRGRGKRQIEDEVSLLAAIQRIEEKYRVQSLFECDYQQEVTEGQIRAYGDKPARTEHKVRFQLTVTRHEPAVPEAECRAGWRIYATNAPFGQLTLTQAVLAYRDQYIEENIFRRLQGKILSITPVYVQRDDHAKGLFHLLTLAARILALDDYTAKQFLAQENAELAGIYSDNPKRSTATPTTERS